MAEGDLVVTDYQYEFNGLLTGKRSPHIMSDVEGLLSMPELLEIDTERQDAPGMFPQLAYPSARTVEFDVSGDYFSGALAEAGRDALERAYNIIEGDYHKFVFQRPFYGKRYLWAQCRKREFVSNYELAHGLLTGSVQLFCPDPRIYQFAEQTQALQIPSPSGLTNSVNITNAGNYKAPWRVSFVGPALNPVITNTTLGRAIRITANITAAQTVVVDSKTRTITINGVETYSAFSNDNEWWHLAPGINSIQVTRGATGAQADFNFFWRGVWM